MKFKKYENWFCIDETRTFHKYTQMYKFEYNKSIVSDTQNFPLKISNPIWLVYFLNQPEFK